MYEGKPIHWPLSSEKKTLSFGSIFIEWIPIRWKDWKLLSSERRREPQRTYKNLFEQKSLATDSKKQKELNNAYTKATDQLVELKKFITMVRECSTKGAPPTDNKCLLREIDTKYDPDLNDGVMINAAALWPLLDPQWRTGSQTPKNGGKSCVMQQVKRTMIGHSWQ